MEEVVLEIGSEDGGWTSSHGEDTEWWEWHKEGLSDVTEKGSDLTEMIGTVKERGGGNE